MHTDPIADMLTRIRNAQMVKKPEVVLPYSKIKYNIAKLLSDEGWLGKVEVLEPLLEQDIKTKNKKNISNKTASDNRKFKQIKIEIKYDFVKTAGDDYKISRPKITSLKRISKPGHRVYVSKDKLPVVLNNYGIAIISTPKGLMTNKQARREGVGGEVICEIY